MQSLPDSVKQLIEAKTYANLGTIMPDGTPHVVQTWIDHEGDLILINTYEGSQKHRNVLKNPNVGLDICDPSNPYNVAAIRGRVKEVTLVGAEEHVDKLAKKYLGQDKYQMRAPGMKRIIIKIEATRVIPPFTDTRRRSS
jgi:PPOX class probable F420-dependent enzyme